MCKVSRYGIHLLEINRINAEQFFEGLIIISGILAVVKYTVKQRLRKPMIKINYYEAYRKMKNCYDIRFKLVHYALDNNLVSPEKQFANG